MPSTGFLSRAQTLSTRLRTSTKTATTTAASAAAASPSAAAAAPAWRRMFSTTRRAQTTAVQQVRARYGKLPPYPYGPRLWYKKSNFGLFGEARVRFGNNVSEQNEIKSRRRWYPNVHRRRLWSNGLGRFVRIKVTARVLRSVDKVGGLDEYLLGDKAARIRELGPGGWALRWRLMRAPPIRERLRRQCAELGVPVPAHLLDAITSSAPPSSSSTPLSTAADQAVSVSPEDAGLSADQLAAREAAIDRALDEDAQRDRDGQDGGVELEDLSETDGRDAPTPKRKW